MATTVPSGDSGWNRHFFNSSNQQPPGHPLIDSQGSEHSGAVEPPSLGSALATIGLTIPAIGLVAIVFDMPMILGLPPKEIVLLVLTFAVSIITLASGRATVLHGTVHLVLFAAFLFLSIVP